MYSYNKEDITGKIVATYDNGDTAEKTITSSMISGLDTSSTDSSQNITITYTENGISKSINTNVYLIQRTGIRISNNPSKLDYIEDECDKLDISGIEIVEVLDNKTENIIPSSEYSVDDFSGFNPTPNSNAYGSQKITVSLYGYEAYYNVNVSKKTLQGVNIQSKPNKLSYVEGQPFDTTGMVLRGRFDNGKYYNLPVSNAIFKMNTVINNGQIVSFGDEVNTSTPGDYTIHVFYPDEAGTNGQTTSYHYATFDITVVKRQAKNIVIKTSPSRTTFPKNDVSYSGYKFSDGELKVTYNDDTTETVSFEDADISGFDITSLGQQAVTVSYDGKSTSFNATVREPELNKTYITAPTTVGYAEGETLSLAGAKINFLYDNGLTSSYSLSGYQGVTVGFSDNSSISAPLTGNKTLVVKYNGTEIKDINNNRVGISVSERVGIEVSSVPTKTQYIEGQSLNISGLKLRSVFANGTKSDIPTDAYSINDVTGFNSNTLGNQELTITVYGKSTTFNVNVREKRIASISVTTPPTKTEYIPGQDLDLTGMVVKATYDNGTVATIPSANITTANIRMNVGTTGNGSEYDLSTTGQKTLYVVVKEDYAGAAYKSASFTVSVVPKEVQSIAIKTMPSKTSYPKNSTSYNATSFGDGVLTATCNCGYVEEVPFSNAGVTISDYDITTVNNYVVTVFYGGKSTTFDATVTEPVLLSTTVTPPTKTSYTQGEAVSMAGAKIVKTYDNGLTEEIDLNQGTDALATAGVEVVFKDAAGNEYPVNDASVTTTTGAKTLVVKYTDPVTNQSTELTMAGGTAVSVNVSQKPAPAPTPSKQTTGSTNKSTGSSGGSNKSTATTPKTTTPKYKNEWINGKWYGADGKSNYSGKLSWKSNSKGWWVEDSAGWYPQNQWQKIDGVWYYFKPDGYMASSEYYDGYWFNKDGSWDSQYYLSWKSNSTGWWVEDKSGWWPSNKWLKVDGDWYYFNGSGYMATSQYVDGYWLAANGVCQ